MTASKQAGTELISRQQLLCERSHAVVRHNHTTTRAAFSAATQRSQLLEGQTQPPRINILCPSWRAIAGGGPGS